MPVASPADPWNALVLALPSKERASLVDASKLIELRSRDVLVDRGERIRHVIFPLGSIVSQLVAAGDYAMMETAMVGREGAAGYVEAIGDRVAAVRHSVTLGGAALQVSVPVLLKILEGSAIARDVFNRHLGTYVAQLSQTVICTRFHQIEPRLARWLLMADDRAASKFFRLTQDELAILLGVRRVGISAASSTFKARQFISYSRGTIRVTDRKALEAAACSCYRDDRVRFDSSV